MIIPRKRYCICCGIEYMKAAASKYCCSCNLYHKDTDAKIYQLRKAVERLTNEREKLKALLSDKNKSTTRFNPERLIANLGEE